MSDIEQLSIAKWHVDQGGHAKRGLSGHSLRLIREAVELCAACGCSQYQILETVLSEVKKEDLGDGFTIGIPRGSVEDEIGDVEILLQLLAYYAGTPVYIPVKKKMEVNLERQWEPDEDGVLWRPGKQPKERLES